VDANGKVSTCLIKFRTDNQDGDVFILRNI